MEFSYGRNGQEADRDAGGQSQQGSAGLYMHQTDKVIKGV